MGIFKSILYLSGKDVKAIHEQMHSGEKECILVIGDFKIDLMMVEVTTTRSGEDKFKAEMSMEPLDEFLEKNMVKPNSNNDVQ